MQESMINNYVKYGERNGDEETYSIKVYLKQISFLIWSKAINTFEFWLSLLVLIVKTNVRLFTTIRVKTCKSFIKNQNTKMCIRWFKQKINQSISCYCIKCNITV